MNNRTNRHRRRTNRNRERTRTFANAMDRTNALLNNEPSTQTLPVVSQTPPPPGYYEELPPAYQSPAPVQAPAPAPKRKLLKRIKNLFTRKKTVAPVRPLSPPPDYSTPLPRQEPRTYAQNNLPIYQPGGNKSRRRRRSKKRRSHKRY